MTLPALRNHRCASEFAASLGTNLPLPPLFGPMLARLAAAPVRVPLMALDRSLTLADYSGRIVGSFSRAAAASACDVLTIADDALCMLTGPVGAPSVYAQSARDRVMSIIVKFCLESVLRW
jgi:hypothetical protein